MLKMFVFECVLSPPLTVEVDVDGVRLLLLDLVSRHAVLDRAAEHRVLVCLGGLHVQRALDGVEARGFLHR